MSLLALVKQAVEIYCKHAYPDGAPGGPADMARMLASFEDLPALLAYKDFEVEENRYALRLGNSYYPHMKMVFLSEKPPNFYVDAHDNHFDLPPGVPGFDKLQEMRKRNKTLKKTIEADWIAASVPVFGQAGPASLPGISQNCKGLKILAVDDESQILDMLKLIVGALGAEFDGVKSAQEAREVIEAKGPPTLIFCDIMMPNESGYDFMTWLKDQGLDHIPFYFITGYALDQVVRTGHDAEVLQKPFTAKAIMKIMKKLKKDLGSDS